LPNFRESVSGVVIYPEVETNRFGCNPYATHFNPDWSGTSLIAMIDRGNCSFVTKVQNAQNAGAAAVIVVNDDATWPGSLPFMSAGAEGDRISIPSMIIYGDDGDVLKQHLNATFGLTVKMSYFLPSVSRCSATSHNAA